MYPTIVSTGNFLYGKPTVQIDEKTFRTLMDTNPDIWIKREKNNPEEDRDICEKTPRRPKRTRNRKQILDQPKQLSPTKHREKITQEFKGKDHEKIMDSLSGTMGEMTDDTKLKLAWSLLDRGEFQTGLILFSSLPWNTYGEAKCNGLGRALTEMGHHQEAKNVLRRGLRKFPQSCSLWVAMGGLYDVIGNHPESLKCFETALRFASEKDYKSVCYNKAVALVKLGCYKDAASILEYLIEEYPENAKYLAERGYCSLVMGYPHEALQYYQRALQLYEKSPTVETGVCVYSGLCCAYMDLGMKKEAMEIALEGLTKFPDADPILYHNVGATFFELGWVGEAKDVLQKGVEKFPDDHELREFLEELENDLDNDPPDGGELLGLLLLIAVIRKKLSKK
jgi:tetratricopeptide (TPR) repeat protein